LLDGSEGTDPPAEDPPQKESEDKSNDGEEKNRKNKAGGQKSAQTDEGIKMKKNLHVADVVFSRKAGL